MRNSILGVATAVVATMVLAGCVMPGDDPNFGLREPGVGEAGSSSDGAAAILAQSSAAPTTIGIDTPLTAKPDAGKLIVSVSDGTPADATLTKSIAAAAETLEWTLTVLPVDGTPESAQAAFEEAIRLKPSGIHVTGSQEEFLAASLASAEEAGIPVVCTGCAGEELGSVKDTAIAGPAQMDEWARMLAAFIAQASSGDASIDYITHPASPGLAYFTNAFITELPEFCPVCSVNQVAFDPSIDVDAANAAANAVSVDILANWLLTDDGAGFTGVEGALDAAGVLEQVQIAGNMGSAENIKGLLDKTQAAWTAYSIPIAGWRVIDSFARLFEGGPASDALLPTQLMTQDNAASLVLDDAGNYVGVADYQDQFTALWKVS